MTSLPAFATCKRRRSSRSPCPLGLHVNRVQALETDHKLIRALARRLAAEDASAQNTRAAILRLLAAEPPKSGGILQALPPLAPTLT